MMDAIKGLAEFELCVDGQWTNTEDAERADAEFLDALDALRNRSRIFYQLDDCYCNAMLAAKAEGYVNGYRQGFEMAFLGLVRQLKGARL